MDRAQEHRAMAATASTDEVQRALSVLAVRFARLAAERELAEARAAVKH
jgi:hypothetical protein